MDCLFCKIINREIPGKIIEETESTLTFLSLDKYPLVIPKKHIENIYAVDPESGKDLMTTVVRIANAVKSGLAADGVKIFQNNGEAAGQSVMHIHFHIKPKFADASLAANISDDGILKKIIAEIKP